MILEPGKCELKKQDIDNLLMKYIKETDIIYPIQIENFNNFLASEIPEIIHTCSTIYLTADELTYDNDNMSFKIYFTKPTVNTPKTSRENQYKTILTPSEARDRNCSYLSDIVLY